MTQKYQFQKMKLLYIFISIILLLPFINCKKDYLTELKKGRAFFKQNQYDSTIFYFSKIHSKFKNHPNIYEEILLKLASSYEKKHDYYNVLQTLKKIKDPIIKEFFEYKTITLTKKYNNIDSTNIFSPLLFYHAFSYYKKIQNYPLALANLKQIKKYKFFNTDSLLIEEAKLFELSNQKDSAIAIYKSIIVNQINHPYYKFAYDKMKILTNKKELSLTKNEMKTRIKLFINKGYPKKGLKELNKFYKKINSYRDKQFYYYYKGLAYYKLKNYTKARKYLRIVINKYPNRFNDAALKYLFLIYWKRNNIRKMIECSNLVKNNNIKAELTYNLIFDFISKGKIRYALKYTGNIKKHKIYLFKSYLRIGLYYISKKQFEKSIRFLNIAINYAQSKYEKQQVYFILGNIYNKLQNEKLATEFFTKSYNLMQGNYYGCVISQFFLPNHLNNSTKTHKIDFSNLKNNKYYKLFVMLYKTKFTQDAYFLIYRLYKLYNKEEFLILYSYMLYNLKKFNKLLYITRNEYENMLRNNNHNYFSTSVLKLMFPLSYKNIIQPICDKYGIDISFIYALIRQESLFNPNAYSKAGAIGLMQLMPYTAKRTAKKNISTQDLFDPKLNLQIGIKHFKKLIDKYNNYFLAVAAYNAGSKAVNRWIKKYDNLNNIFLFIELIPYYETRNYVKIVYRNSFYYKKLLFKKDRKNEK